MKVGTLVMLSAYGVKLKRNGRFVDVVGLVKDKLPRIDGWVCVAWNFGSSGVESAIMQTRDLKVAR